MTRNELMCSKRAHVITVFTLSAVANVKEARM